MTPAQVSVIADAVTEDNVARATEQDIDRAAFDAAWAQVATSLGHDKLGHWRPNGTEIIVDRLPI